MFDLSTIQAMNSRSKKSDQKNRYVITVPTTIYNIAAASSIINGVRDMVKKTLSKEFGGYTEIPASGGYMADDGTLIEESVYNIETISEKFNPIIIADIAKKIKSEMNQESVMVQINNNVEFVR